MSVSAGQELALRQLRSIELAESRGLEIVTVVEPADDERHLVVEVSLDCRGLLHEDDGIRVRSRERFSLLIDRDFPFNAPSTFVRHRRWAGTPHVQWRRHLCLYQAEAVEWAPADGMYGYIERLLLWVERASAGTLDPAGAPLHPPVAYVDAGAPLIIPRADTPEIVDEPWLGYASLERLREGRYDVVDWRAEHDAGGALQDPPAKAAAAVLLAESMDWEFPRTVGGLLVALKDRGVDLPHLIAHLGFTAISRASGEPLIVIVGTPMRGTVGRPMRQHLTAWRIPAEQADQLTLALGRYSKREGFREIGDQAIDQVLDWAGSAAAEWCPVREARAEVAERRDSESPMQSFAGKKVVIWGCGAVGAPIAEWIARAGASEIIVYDSARVTPGVLVRQPYSDDEVGEPKAKALATRLDAIDRGVSVTGRHRDVLRGPLEEADWHDGAEILVDATASVTVQAKLERVRRAQPQQVTVITTIIGHTAENAIATIAFPAHSGVGVDTLRATKLACARDPRLGWASEEFWPDPPRTDLFQPEPGCSSPTFRGSGAEVGSLAATLLARVSGELARTPEGETAVAWLLSLPPGPQPARIALPAATTIEDSRGRFEIRVARETSREIEAWVASGRRELDPGSETGGLLFGQRDDAVGVIWIDEVSGPPSDSAQSPEEFVCGTAGVQELTREKSQRTSGSVEFLGMWHTHPRRSADFSARDLSGMLELLRASDSPRAEGVVVIVGWAAGDDPELGAYVFEHEALRRDHATITVHEPAPLAHPRPAIRDVGLALSGGGSRGIAFHLGCLRALHDRGVLERVRVVSGVSGGSVIGAIWAYSPDEGFEAFDERVQELLQRGLQGEITRRALVGWRAPQAAGSALIAGGAGAGVRVFTRARRVSARAFNRETPEPIEPPFRRWVSRTTAFEDALGARLFGDTQLSDPRRADLDVILNACDLRTGSAFRFGSRESGTWRRGTVVEDVPVATAVAASAAYPLLLPPLDREWTFEHRGNRERHRVVLTDGGVFDNLGTTCLEPGRDPGISTNVVPVGYVVACDAGRGLLGATVPMGWTSRVGRAFEATFRKVQDGARGRLHSAVENGELRGFVLPYLGQLDEQLPHAPPDLVPRREVRALPTNFMPMAEETLAILSRRGEQLTRLLIERYCPQL